MQFLWLCSYCVGQRRSRKRRCKGSSSSENTRTCASTRRYPSSVTAASMGGGGGATFNITHYLGIKAELLGYGSTTFGGTFSSPVVTPHGTIPAGTFSTQGNMFTYLFGPVIKFPTSRLTPFGEILFGGSHSNGYANLERAIIAGGGTINAGGTQNPF